MYVGLPYSSDLGNGLRLGGCWFWGFVVFGGSSSGRKCKSNQKRTKELELQTRLLKVIDRTSAGMHLVRLVTITLALTSAFTPPRNDASTLVPEQQTVRAHEDDARHSSFTVYSAPIDRIASARLPSHARLESTAGGRVTARRGVARNAHTHTRTRAVYKPAVHSTSKNKNYYEKAHSRRSLLYCETRGRRRCPLVSLALAF